MRFLITGANGFVGKSLCGALVGERPDGQPGSPAPHQVRAATRDTDLPGLETFRVGSIGRHTDWTAAVADVDVVIHLAARVHVMNDTAEDPLAAFVETNVHGTLQLAAQAAESGVRRFVYVSSIKVNGESTAVDRPFRASDPADPQDPYSISKWQAEQALAELAQRTGMELVVVRPPLVYGPGVKANFARLLDLVARTYPLPFRGIANRRSMIYVGNLADALICCATHPAAAGNTWLVADGAPVSSSELVAAMAQAMERPSRDFHVPVWMMRLAGSLMGKSPAIDRLTQSLVVDNHRIERELGWHPPYSFAEGIAATAQWYRQNRR